MSQSLVIICVRWLYNESCASEVSIFVNYSSYHCVFLGGVFLSSFFAVSTPNAQNEQNNETDQK